MRQPPLWLCLYFYALPVNLLMRTGQYRTDKPLAVAEQQHIVFVNEAARSAGIEVNMRLGTGYALQPEMQVVERKPAAEAKALQQLLKACYQYTPSVALYKKFCLLLEIGGSLKLFKSLPRLLARIQQDLHRQGYCYRHGLGHTPEAAWLFSQCPPCNAVDLTTVPPREQFLAQLKKMPLGYLDLDPKQLGKLQNLGLRTIGEVLALPRWGLGRRLGKPVVELLEKLSGEQLHLPQDWLPPVRFESGWDFSNGVTCVDELVAPMEQLLRRFRQFLWRQHFQVRSFSWQLFYYKQPGDKIKIHVAGGNSNLAALSNLTRLKLNHYSPPAPVESIALVSNDFCEAGSNSRELFPELSHPQTQLQEFYSLLDRLLSRLGDNALHRVCATDEHLPELKHQCSPLQAPCAKAITLPPASEQQTIAKSTGHQPLWLLPQAIRLQQHEEELILYHQGSLRIVYGPQRIDSHWWQQRRQRDYFIARHQNGSYCWVFFDLIEGDWFLQGFFG